MIAPSPSVAAAPELFTREDDNGVVTLTLNTPRSLNALSLAMLEALIAEFEAIASDDRGARHRARGRGGGAQRRP